MQKGHCAEGCAEGMRRVSVWRECTEGCVEGLSAKRSLHGAVHGGVCGGSECKKVIAQRGAWRGCVERVAEGLSAKRSLHRGDAQRECMEGVCGGVRRGMHGGGAWSDVQRGNLLWVYVLFQKYCSLPKNGLQGEYILFPYNIYLYQKIDRPGFA